MPTSGYSPPPADYQQRAVPVTLPAAAPSGYGGSGAGGGSGLSPGAVAKLEAANRRQVGEIRPESLQRPWIIDRQHALNYAVEYLNLRSQPALAGPVSAKRESAAAGLPGDLVRISSDSYGLSIICRITERANPSDRSGLVELTVENERGLYPVLFAPVPPPRIQDFLVVATVIEHARMFLLPSGLKDTANPQVAPLAERPDATLTGFRLHVSRDGTTYDLLVGDCPFAIRGELTAAYPATTAALDLSHTLSIEIDGIDADLVQSQSDGARDANDLLLFLDNEILSVGEVTAVGSGVYTLTVRRALYGTVKGAHGVGQEGYFLLRENLARAERVGTIAPDNAIFFKLQTHNQRADQDLAEALVIPYTVPELSAVGLINNLILQTDVEAGAGGSLLSHVWSFWEFAPDQGITGFEAGIRRADATEDDWVYRTTTSPEADFVTEPGVLYLVKVRAVNAQGEESYWTDPVPIVSATPSQFFVTGLAVAGVGAVPGSAGQFGGDICKLVWRLNSPLLATEIGQEGETGVTDGTYDPTLADYELGMFQPDVANPNIPGEQVFSRLVINPHYKIHQEERVEAFGSPQAGFWVQVRPRERSGAVGPWAALYCSNPPPAAPSALIVANAGFQQNHLLWLPSGDLDLKVTQILFSASTDYATAVEAGRVQADTQVFAHVGVKGAKKLYYWVRHRDTNKAWGPPYPPASSAGVMVNLNGINLGAGATQLNADIDGNTWLGSDGFANAPIRFSADGSILVGGTGNHSIDISAINAAVKAPKLIPAATTFDSTITVQLLSKTSGADAIYTMDGSIPTLANGTRVPNNGSVTLNATTRLRAVGTKLGSVSTTVRDQTYTLAAGACADPALYPPGGTFSPASFPVPVTPSCATGGAQIRYSFDHMPTGPGDATAYGGGTIPVGIGQTLYARAFKSGATSGPGRQDTYLQVQDPWNGGNQGPMPYDPPTPPGTNVP